jgi:ankyrin repeat protein
MAMENEVAQDVSEVLNAAYLYHDDRFSPLMLAASSGHVKVVRLLLQHGASVTYRSPGGRSTKGTTSLHEAD